MTCRFAGCFLTPSPMDIGVSLPGAMASRPGDLYKAAGIVGAHGPGCTLVAQNRAEHQRATRKQTTCATPSKRKLLNPHNMKIEPGLAKRLYSQKLYRGFESPLSARSLELLKRSSLPVAKNLLRDRPWISVSSPVAYWLDVRFFAPVFANLLQPADPEF